MRLTQLYLLIFTLSLQLGIHAQLTHSVFFNVDEDFPNRSSQQMFQTFLDSVKKEHVEILNIQGFTDSDASNAYNLKLSERRAINTLLYIQKQTGDSNAIHFSFHGEVNPKYLNNSEANKGKNRRVDIHYRLLPPPFIPVKKDTVIKEELPDTIHIRTKNYLLVFNRKEYEEKKKCIEISEAFDPSDIESQNLGTQTENGAVLASCGMIRIKFNETCKGTTCFDHPVTVFMPYRDEACNPCGINPYIWQQNRNGTWTTVKKSQLSTVVLEGRKWYKMKIKCPLGWMNCDCNMGGSKIKFKTNFGNRILSLTLLNECPASRAKLSHKRFRKNIAKNKKYPCWGDAKLSAIVLTKKGDTLTYNNIPLRDLPKQRGIGKCKMSEKEEKKWIGIFPLKKRSRYKKYYLKEDRKTKN